MASGRGGDGLFCFFPGEAFEQLEVMAVVAGNGFEDDLEGDRAALGVGGGTGEIVGLYGGEEADVPGAEALVGELRRGEVVGGVAVAPTILIEGLEGGVVGGEGLADAPAPHEFAIGEVGHELAEAPLLFAWGVIDLFRGVGGEELAEVGGGFADDTDGFAAFEVVRVGILFHGDDATTVMWTMLARR